MAADSSMKNISGVQEYARELDTISRNLMEIFQKLKRRTDEVGNNWQDAQFEQFHQIYNDVIMKQAEGTVQTLQKLSVYAKKQCEFNLMANQHKLNL